MVKFVLKDKSAGTLVAIPEDHDVEFDASKECMSTILAFLEQERIIDNLNGSQLDCSLSCISDRAQDLLLSSRALAAIMGSARPVNGQWKFSPVAIANLTDSSPAAVLSELRRFSFQRLIRLQADRKCFVCSICKNTSDQEQEQLVDRILARLRGLEERQVRRVLTLERMMEEADKISSRSPEQHAALSGAIERYFESAAEEVRRRPRDERGDKFLRGDIISFLHSFAGSHKLFSGRVIARIFHGLPSPAFSARMWQKNSSWGRYKSIDFQHIKELAEEMIRQRGK
eukprot:754410-Hanusia_phi.AAC.2